MFGWIDFSDEERRRASEVMNLVRYPGAIDELGFGILRDAFADKLFPATSTLHTHARYYYLVSYLMKDIERNGVGKSLSELQAILQDGEIRTCRRLVAWSKYNPSWRTGITGSDSLDSGWVKMTPASMDWAAIQRLGIFRDANMKMRGFLNSVSNTPKGNQAIAVAEDGSESSAEYSDASLWDVPLAIYKNWDHGDELALMLEPEEAMDLKSRIKKRFPNTAYASIVDCKSPANLRDAIREPEFNSVSFISLIDSNELLQMNRTPELVALCEVAANLSSFVSLLHIRFNYVLRSKAEVPDFKTNYASLLWKRYAYNPGSTYHRRTMKLDIGSVFEACDVHNTGTRNTETYQFLQAAQKAYLNKDLDALDSLIEKREKHLKGEPRSKIANAKAYADQWFGGIELTYRLEVALMVANEIILALGAKDD